MSQTMDFRSSNKDFTPQNVDVDVERSILDVRKVYHDMPLEVFVRMYQSRFKVKAAEVRKILHCQDRILEARKERMLLSQEEFAQMFKQEHKVKEKFVLMVLQDHEKE